MTTEEIISELAGIRAAAKVLADRSERLQAKLSNQGKESKPSNHFNEKMALVLASREKRYQKK